MPNINKANRQVCDVDIRSLDRKPVLFFETANTTTQALTGESVYATAKGVKRIAFANPIEGTITIEAQVYPFELYSLISGGVIETDAAYPEKAVVKADADGSLKVPANAMAGSVFVYKNGEFAGTEIAGTFADGTFTAAVEGDIKTGEEYEVGYVATKASGVKRIAITNSKLPKAYYITMDTVEKDENEVLTPYKMIFYKAQPQRNFSLSQSSAGDPASITMTFDLLEDKDGNFAEIVEISDEAE